MCVSAVCLKRVEATKKRAGSHVVTLPCNDAHRIDSKGALYSVRRTLPIDTHGPDATLQRYAPL